MAVIFLEYKKSTIVFLVESSVHIYNHLHFCFGIHHETFIINFKIILKFVKKHCFDFSKYLNYNIQDKNCCTRNPKKLLLRIDDRNYYLENINIVERILCTLHISIQ